MTSRKEIVERVMEAKAVAVLRLREPKKVAPVVRALYEGGIRGIQISMTVPHAIELIAECAQEFGDQIVLGVGSIVDSETARQAIEAGADFVVSPVFKLEVLQTSLSLNKPCFPGAFTPTEIFNAFQAGADIVKVFPANILGMDFFKEISAPLPHLKLMPIGGVSLSNAGDWLKAGACTVGIGSSLVNSVAIKDENYWILTQNAKKLMKSIERWHDHESR